MVMAVNIDDNTLASGQPSLFSGRFYNVLCVPHDYAIQFGNIFHVTGPLRGESTGDRWIPFTKASDAELRCCLWSAPEQTVEQTIETPVIYDAIALIMTECTVQNRWRYSKQAYRSLVLENLLQNSPILHTLTSVSWSCGRQMHPSSPKVLRWRHMSARVSEIRSPMNSPHKGPVMRETFPFDDVIMDMCN